MDCWHKISDSGPDQECCTLLNAILNDPPEARWRSVRALARVRDESTQNEILEKLRSILEDGDTAPVKAADLPETTVERIRLALRMVGDPDDPIAVKAGRRQAVEVEEAARTDGCMIPFPVVDFHVHPKRCDDELIRDFKSANARAVILATDTDPSDMDRPEVIEHIRKTYIHSDISRMMGFDRLISEIRGSLRSVTHVSNRDVLDMVRDHPDVLTGFGSVDLVKEPEYVDKTLQWIADYGLRGIKLLPFSQFFDPAGSGNAERMMRFCRDNGLIVLSHTGCSAGVFESPYLNMYSRPSRWEKLAAEYLEVPVVLAHFGSYSEMAPGIWFDEAVELMAKCPNVYADTAAVWRLLWNEEMVRMIRDNGIMDRVLFGTDYPMPVFFSGGERGVVLSILENELLTDAEKEAVLGGNALRLLGEK